MLRSWVSNRSGLPALTRKPYGLIRLIIWKHLVKQYSFSRTVAFPHRFIICRYVCYPSTFGSSRDKAFPNGKTNLLMSVKNVIYEKNAAGFSLHSTTDGKAET